MKILLALSTIVLVAVSAACSPAATPVPLPGPTSPPGTTPAPSPSPVPPTTATVAPTMDIQVLVANLDIPWAIDFAPDGRIFFTERPGHIRVIQGGRLLAEPWLTLDVAATGEAGLLGLALDPQFAQNGFVYAAYTYRGAAGQLQNRLVRLREQGARGAVDRTLLDGIKGGNIHDGGRVKFGPDGKLYWTMGETGSQDLAQDAGSLNGKILRLNPDGSIPADNPFPGSPIYSYGHRNPQGLAWQPGTGRLYATEHGPSGFPGGRDELNYIEPGKNYGWPVISGDQTRQGMVSPLIQSGSDTWAPGGAAFVREGAWDGSLLFTGLRGQALYRVTLDRTDPLKLLSFEKLLAGQYGRLRDIVQGPDGALYLLTNNRDGRGSPAVDDDKILKFIVK